MYSKQPENKNKTIQVNEEIKLFNLSIYRSVALIHGIGYGLILFGAIDIFSFLISTAWFTSGWFLVVLEQFVNSMPVLLLGLSLSFFSELKPRLAWEFHILRVLSWATLILCGIFPLLMALAIYATTQVIDQGEQTLSRKEQIEQLRLDTLKSKVSATNSLQDLKTLSQAIGIEETNDKEVKNEILQNIKSQKNRIEKSLDSKIFTARFKSIKKILKLSLGAILASFLCFWLWRNTGWARSLKRN